ARAHVGRGAAHVGLVTVLAPDGARVRRYDIDLGPVLFHRGERLRQLGILEPVRCEDRYALSAQMRHGVSPISWRASDTSSQSPPRPAPHPVACTRSIRYLAGRCALCPVPSPPGPVALAPRRVGWVPWHASFSSADTARSRSSRSRCSR